MEAFIFTDKEILETLILLGIFIPLIFYLMFFFGPRKPQDISDNQPILKRFYCFLHKF